MLKHAGELYINKWGDVMNIELSVVSEKELKKVWKMQKIGFAEWDKKYHEGKKSVANEPYKKILERFKRHGVIYHFILKDKEPIGVICVRTDETTGIKQIAPIWIMPDFINQGYGQKAIKLLEEIHGTSGWELRTGINEKRNIHFYEKLGYKKTEGIETINKYLSIITLVK